MIEQKVCVAIYLQDVYKSLSSVEVEVKRNGINKIPFLDYINLPFIFGERLFILMMKENKEIHLSDFIEGMLALYFHDEILPKSMMFNLLDLDDDGVIWRKDLEFLLKYCNISSLSCKIANTLDSLFEQEKYINLTSFNQVGSNIIFDSLFNFILTGLPSIKHVPVYSLNKKHKKDITKKMPYRNLELLSTAYSINSDLRTSSHTLNKNKLISNEEFDQDEIDMQELETTTGIYIPSLKISPNRLINDQVSKIVEEKLCVTTTYKQEFDTEMKSDYCGFIYRFDCKNKRRKYYYRLIGKDLCSFSPIDRNKMRGLYNLTSSYVEDGTIKEIENRKYYSFFLTFRDKNRVFYCKTLDEKEFWMKHIKKNLKQKNIFKYYDMINDLGEGSFAKVKSGVNKKTNESVAIKVYSKKLMSQTQRTFVKSEIEILKMCNHSNIITYIDTYESKDYTYIVMENFKAVSLDAYFLLNKDKGVDESFIRDVILQVGEGLKYLHDNSIMHRDIKLENILISEHNNEMIVKIIDFGLSKILPSWISNNQYVGSMSFIAPEIHMRKGYNNKVDLWSLGVMVYNLLCGMFPYHKNDYGLEFIHKSWVYRSKQVKDLIIECLNVDKKERINICEFLRHKWFQTNN